MKYVGLSFPKMFNSGTKTSNVVEGVEKIRSDIRLLLKQQVREVLFNPSLGVDLESILFADDPLITRDFIYSFVNDAITRNMQDVRLKDVAVKVEGSTATAALHFIYERGNVNFNVDLSLKGAQYE